MAFSRRCGLLSLFLLGIVRMDSAWAQPELVADLAISIAPPLPVSLAPGSSGEFEITITNLGPDDAGFDSMSELPLVARTSLQMERPDGGLDVYFSPAADGSGPCVLVPTVLDPVPGGRPQWSYGAFFPPLAAGSSTTCRFGYALDPSLIGRSASITWRIRTFTEVDPNPENDTHTQVFAVGLPPAPTPVPMMSPWALLLMIGSMRLAAGYGAKRRQA
jgi:hypothetical protein